MNVRQAMNLGSLTGLASFFQKMQIGGVLRTHLKTDLRNKTPVASASQLATLAVVPMDPAAPAASIIRAFPKVGTAAVGAALTVDAYGATPATLHCAIAPNGDIVTLLADAWTNLDVEYMPTDGDTVSFTVPVVPGTGVCAIPAAYAKKAIYLRKAVALTGTLTGEKIVLVRSAAAPATTKALLDLAGDNVLFAVADAVTSATITLYISKGVLVNSVDLDTYLQSTSDAIV